MILSNLLLTDMLLGNECCDSCVSLHQERFIIIISLNV